MRVEALPPLVSGGRSWDCIMQGMMHCPECSKLETWEGRHYSMGVSEEAVVRTLKLRLEIKRTVWVCWRRAWCNYISELCFLSFQLSFVDGWLKGLYGGLRQHLVLKPGQCSKLGHPNEVTCRHAFGRRRFPIHLSGTLDGYNWNGIMRPRWP
jgi:hypothetical protein